MSIDLKSLYLHHLDVANFNKTNIKVEQAYINATWHIVSSSLYIIIV